MSARKWLLAMSLVCGISTGVAATRSLPADAVLLEPDASSVVAHEFRAEVERLLPRIAAGDAQGVMAQLQAMDDDPSRCEAIAALLIDRLQAWQPAPAVERVLAMLETTPVRVFRRHEETAADWFLPVYDIPTRAASVRRLRFRAQQRQLTLEGLQRDPQATLARAGKANDETALADALETASHPLLDQVAQLALRSDSVLPGRAWAVLAQRQPQPRILMAALRYSEPVDLLPLFETVPARLSASAALDWLEQATRRPEYASTAVLALGRLAARSAVAADAVAKRLGDPLTGASAAAALARLPVKDRLGYLDALIAQGGSPERLADLALALRLEGSASALQRLEQLRRDPRLTEATRKELQR